MPKIEPPRIGTGVGYFIGGGVSIVLGAMMSAASTPLDSGPAAIGGFLFALGAALFAVGFWVKLFGALERRLIDIQMAVTRTPAPAVIENTGTPIVASDVKP